ncbi:uncharacterized protein LOC143244868 isoform X2 [Tachypleus tridentatus]|uniref:uncharacterized protein LOC143244868 isoform X2 n=1 Tax=Tachypleus tridentatus TaxID=6853 RepID=UPI003FD64E33
MILEMMCIIQHTEIYYLSTKAIRELIILQHALRQNLRLQLGPTNRPNRSFSDEVTKYYNIDETDEIDVVATLPSLTMLEIMIALEHIKLKTSNDFELNEIIEDHSQTIQTVLATACKHRTNIVRILMPSFPEITIKILHPIYTHFKFTKDMDPLQFIEMCYTLESDVCPHCVSFVKYSSDFVTKHMQWLMPLNKLLLSSVIFIRFEPNSIQHHVNATMAFTKALLPVNDTKIQIASRKRRNYNNEDKT